MKNLILLLYIITPFLVSAQEKPGKLRIENGFFTNRYEIGDKTTPSKQVALHLKQHDTDAYIKWKDANRAQNNFALWSIVGSVGVLVGIFAPETQTKVVGYSAAAVGYGIALVPLINSSSRRQKSIDMYNRKFGY